VCGLWRRSAGSETVKHAQNNQAFLQAYVARARIVQKKTCIICWSARPRTGPPLCATASYSKTDAGVFSSDTLSPNPGFFGRVSISVSMPACHAGELGSIPRRGGSMILPIRNRMVSLFDEIPIFTWGWSPFLFRVASQILPIRYRRMVLLCSLGRGGSQIHPIRNRMVSFLTRSSPTPSAATRSYNAGGHPLLDCLLRTRLLLQIPDGGPYTPSASALIKQKQHALALAPGRRF